jgi:Type II CAAX prenyl endopeptidase Rce1-like
VRSIRACGERAGDYGSGGKMCIREEMSVIASQTGVPVAERRSPESQAVAAVEVLATFAGILFYIWQWQYSHPYSWIPMLGLVVLSHVLHHDSARELGLTMHELRASARIILPLALAILLPVLVYGFMEARLGAELFSFKTLRYFGAYLVWCAFQQYLTQSFFHTRLMRVFRNRHASSVLIGVMFGAAHIPNPVLMAVTALGGFVLAEVFARYRNIWPLALTQAIFGALLAALIPASLIHNMRVGPGYFFFNQS